MYGDNVDIMADLSALRFVGIGYLYPVRPAHFLILHPHKLQISLDVLGITWQSTRQPLCAPRKRCRIQSFLALSSILSRRHWSLTTPSMSLKGTTGTLVPQTLQVLGSATSRLAIHIWARTTRLMCRSGCRSTLGMDAYRLLAGEDRRH
jgi:hypothetical protein